MVDNTTRKVFILKISSTNFFVPQYNLIVSLKKSALTDDCTFSSECALAETGKQFKRARMSPGIYLLDLEDNQVTQSTTLARSMPTHRTS